MKCGEARCPMYDQMVTQNDGKSFQSGCGWDILDTGCCFELDNSSYSCWRCENLAFVPNNVTCPDDWLRNWVFHSSADVPLDFKSPVAGEILRCGSDLSPMPQDKFANEMTSQTLTSNIFLCGRSEWIQGDYIDDAGLGQTSGIGTDFGLKPGRHVRVNHNNYQRVAGQQITWIEGPEEPGEGIYECFNSVSVLDCVRLCCTLLESSSELTHVIKTVREVVLPQIPAHVKMAMEDMTVACRCVATSRLLVR